MDYTPQQRNASLTPWITMEPIKQENWPSNITKLSNYNMHAPHMSSSSLLRLCTANDITKDHVCQGLLGIIFNLTQGWQLGDGYDHSSVLTTIHSRKSVSITPSNHFLVKVMLHDLDRNLVLKSFKMTKSLNFVYILPKQCRCPFNLTNFFTKIYQNHKIRKNSWKFVYILHKQCRCSFNLTKYF